MSSINRIDKELAFMLQFENVAWYDEGCVKILDRRVYPNKVNFVECKTHRDVSKAIADENYELASHLRDEKKRRNKGENNDSK